MTDLFAITDLASFLQQDVDTSSATVARQVASGWLMSATRLTTWPTPVPDALFAWAIELAAIAYRNPEGLTSESIDDHASTWDRLRRGEILALARATYGGTSAPAYSFPDADWHWTVVPSVNVETF